MQHDLLELETKLVGAGCTNSYEQLAYLNAVLKNVVERDEKFSRERGSSGHGNADEDGDGTIKPIYSIVEDYDRTERAQRDGKGDGSDKNAPPTPSERASEGLQVLDTMQSLRDKVNVSWQVMLVERMEQSLAVVDEEDRKLGIAGLNQWLQEVSIISRRNFQWLSVNGSVAMGTDWRARRKRRA